MTRALALWLLIAGAVHAAELPDLKGLRLGMTEAEILTAMPSLRCQAPKTKLIGDRVCTDNRNSIVGLPAAIIVSLAEDKAYRISIYFGDAAAAQVRDALIAKFGPVQHRETRDPVTTSDGRTITRIDDNWGFPMQALQLVHLKGASTRSWVSLTDLEFAKRTYEQRQKDI